MKVVDASALIDLLVGSDRRDALRPLLDDDLFAPDLIIAEVSHAVGRLQRSAAISGPAAEAAAVLLAQAPIEYLPIWPYATQIWTLRHNLSAYDAAYVAMAQDLGAPLVTTDLRLARAAAGLVAVISV